MVVAGSYYEDLKNPFPLITLKSLISLSYDTASSQLLRHLDISDLKLTANLILAPLLIGIMLTTQSHTISLVYKVHTWRASKSRLHR